MKGLRAGVATALVMVVTVACGSSSTKATSTTAPNPTARAALFSTLPPDIQAAKEIKVGSDVSYAPIEFFKEGTQQADGVDYDIGQALGDKLRLRANVGFGWSGASTTFVA